MKVYLLFLLSVLANCSTYYARLKYCKCVKEHSSQYFCESYECLEQYTGKRAGDCFDSEATVIVGHGKTKKLKELQIGDTIYRTDKVGELQPDTFVGFLHLDVEKNTKLVVFRDQESKVLLEVSEYHVVYAKVEGQEGYYFGLELEKGDMVIHNGQYVEIADVSYRNSTGIVTPLTESGMIEVDGGLASNYAYYKEQDTVHMAFWVYRMLPYKTQMILDYYVNALEWIRSII